MAAPVRQRGAGDAEGLTAIDELRARLVFAARGRGRLRSYTFELSYTSATSATSAVLHGLFGLILDGSQKRRPVAIEIATSTIDSASRGAKSPAPNC